MGLIFNGNGDVIKAVDGSLTVEGLDIGGSTNIEAGIGTFSGNLTVGGVLTYEDVKNVDSVGIVTARSGVKVNADGSASSNYISVGAGDDLKLFHDGTHNYARATNTGQNLYLQTTDSQVIIGEDGGHIGLVYAAGGAVTLRHNNSDKFATTSSGISVTGGVSISGSSTFTGNVFDFADSKQLRFGTGNDFEMFFNGTDQYLKAKAGKIRVQVNDGESSITCNVNAGVEIYYDDAKKLETTNTGVTVTGGVTATSGTFSGDISCGEISITDSIYHVGDLNTRIRFPGADTFAVDTGGSERLRIKSGGEVRIGDNTTTASTAGDDLVIEGSSDRGLSIISGTSSSSNIYFGDSGDADIGRLAYQNNDNAFDFHTNAGGTAKLRIASNGALIQKATSGDNQFYSQRTNTAGSDGNYFFHMKAQDENGNNVGELGFHRDTAADDARFIVKTRNTGGSSTERLRIKSDGFSEFYGGASFVKAGFNYVRIGSTNASGATLALDGDSNGDGSGADYCMFRHDTDGHLKIFADNPANAADTIFYSNSATERMRITSAGNVLIGNTSGSEKLDVTGWIQSTSGFKTAGHPIATYASFTDISGGSYATRLGSTGSSTLRSTQIYGGGSHIATFDGVNTRLGIKVTAPGAPLHIGGPSEIRLDNAADGGNFARIQCFEESSNNHAILAFSVGSGEALRIANDGRVTSTITSNKGGIGLVGAFMARVTSVYDFAAGTRKINMATEEFDANGWYDTSNSRYKPLCKGWYQLHFHLQFKTGITGNSIEMQLYPYFNGSSTQGPVQGWSTNYGNYAYNSYSTMMYFDGVNDYVEMYGNCSHTTDVAVATRMMGYLVHPTAS